MRVLGTTPEALSATPNQLVGVRNDVVEYLKAQVIGPSGGAEELLSEPPDRRYLTGILYPRAVRAIDATEAAGETPDQPQATDRPRPDESGTSFTVSDANAFLPSSLGCSFLTDATKITVTVRAGRYETSDGEPEAPDAKSRRKRDRRWRRVQLETESLIADADLRRLVWDERAQVDVRWRPVGRGSLVTVTLANAQEGESPARMWDDMLFQAEVEVLLPIGSTLLEYPSPSNASKDPDEQEGRLQYRTRRTYAVGHGCSASWIFGTSGTTIRSEVMPTADVPAITAAGDVGAEVLRLTRLERAHADELLMDLSAFVDAYGDWVDGCRRQAEELEAAHSPAASRVLDRLHTAVARMRDGVACLRENPDALRAFRLANRAMRLQMRHSKSDLAGMRRPRTEPAQWPSYDGYEPSWRPFQLGFVLLSLRGLVDSAHEDRDIVDLIWFPTGGGKTEAYLLLALTEIFHRRLQDPVAGGGTAVLSRYTLSLLTAQQFQRAAATTCAAEVVRRELPRELGEEPISIGLWVGDATTPNRYADAAEAFEELRDAEEPRDRFLLERCPWCGTQILPRSHTEDDSEYGILASPSSFRFFCPRGDCPFHERLWVHVVDDDVYEHPPTFVLGTVDKFARLAWEERAGVLFGGADNRPPSLVIQDELHLLTGPLGTIVGLYETAIQLLCEEDGRPPKVVASTATIRRASEQVRGLYAREVQLFPPSGLDAEDSYFATIDRSRPSRLYVGVMAQGHTADTATVQTAAALMQAPVDLDLEGEAADAYWTLVAYHNSLRELGRTVTMASDDIPNRLEALAGPDRARIFDVEELTSNVDRSLQPRLLERLGLSRSHDDHVGLLATTNMLSVGVDVPRLALMLVNGQPKTTAEYIQATSRVGRDRTPGLIVSLFRSARPRDRSHYESFGSYHAALYRHVEPSSVTPWSPPARDRALHAALVILARHSVGMRFDDQATEILERLPEVEVAAARIVDIVRRAEPREAEAAAAELATFIDTWVADAGEAKRAGRRLYFQPHGRGHTNLLKNFNAQGGGRETLQSMRNVDQESLVYLWKTRAKK